MTVNFITTDTNHVVANWRKTRPGPRLRRLRCDTGAEERLVPFSARCLRPGAPGLLPPPGPTAFSDSATGSAHFHPAAPPTDEEVVRLLATIRFRVRRLLQRRGLEGDDDLTDRDPWAEESLALAVISSASVQGRIALGRRAGARVWRLGHDPEALWITSTGPRSEPHARREPSPSEVPDTARPGATSRR